MMKTTLVIQLSDQTELSMRGVMAGMSLFLLVSSICGALMTVKFIFFS